MCTKQLSLPALTCIHSHMPTNHKNIQPIVSSINHLITNDIDQIALVAITLHFDSAQAAAHIQQSTSYYQKHLRQFVRKTDQIILSESSMYFLLLKAHLQGAEFVQNRLWDALLWHIHNAGEQHVLRPLSMSIGHSAYPKPIATLPTCILAAKKTQRHFETQAENQRRTKDTDAYILARQLGIPYLPLLPRTLSPGVLQMVSPKLAQELRCYPVGRARNTLTVAMSDPCDEQALTRLKQETGLQIFPVVVSPQELQTALEQII
jgi:prophage antirepressor-like protein